MRITAMIILTAALAGCAAQTGDVAAVQQVPHYQASNTAALAFDPPVLEGMPRMDLSRDDRGPAAFQGFEQAGTTYYSIQTGDCGDGYDRQAVTETSGSVIR